MRRASCNRAPEKEGGRSPIDVEGALLWGPNEEGLSRRKAWARPVIRPLQFSQGQSYEINLVRSHSGDLIDVRGSKKILPLN